MLQPALGGSSEHCWAWPGCLLHRQEQEGAGCFQKDWEPAGTALAMLKDGIHLTCWE